MIKIGITGSISSGKSTVSEAFHEAALAANNQAIHIGNKTR